MTGTLAEPPVDTGRPGADCCSDVNDLVVQFRTHDGTIHAVNGVSFQLARGERLGLVGESGCGKSVTNLAIIRLLPKPAGRIERRLGPVRRRRPRDDGRGGRPRDPRPRHRDDLPGPDDEPQPGAHGRGADDRDDRRPPEDDQGRGPRRAAELLSMVGIPQPERRLKSFPHQFSGGMRQRVMIAMALALEPKLMIADEPTTALDVTIQAQVLELISRLTTETGTSLVLITHDLGVVAGMTDRINVMYAGFIVETATTGDLFEAPSHPYTVGLLHSMPRVDDREGEPLIPIEGPAAGHAQRPRPAARSRPAARGASTCAGPTTRARAGDPGTRSSRPASTRRTGSPATTRRRRRRPSTAIPAGPVTSRPPPAGQLDELASYAALADGAITAEHLAAPRRRGRPTTPRSVTASTSTSAPRAPRAPRGRGVTAAPVPPDGSDGPPGASGRRRRPLLRVKDLKVWFPITEGMLIERHVGDVRAVDGVTFDLHRGETLGLVGESGCGKTTTGRAIVRLYKPTSGRIEFDGDGHLDGRRARRCSSSAAGSR